MIQKLKTKLLIVATLLFVSAPMLAPVAAHAATDPSQGVCHGASTLKLPDSSTNYDPGSGQCTDTANGTNKLNDIITTVINVFSVIVGIVAVIMIIVGGFRYITSAGDSAKVTSAKNTILYALIGLIIVALAQVIVKFVLNKTVTS